MTGSDLQNSADGALVGSGPEEGLTRAIIGGAVAAVLGGALWALVVLLTNYEIGWIAWAVGAVVGIVMARLTTVRGQAIAVQGAILAAVGLLLGKGLIVGVGAKPALVAEIMADSTWVVQVAMQDLRDTEEWPDDVQEGLDGLSSTDTIPDALWDDMITAGAAHWAAAGEAGREQMASAYAGALISSLGYGELLRSQFSAWDLLWFGLAIATVWRMLRGAETSSEPG